MSGLFGAGVPLLAQANPLGDDLLPWLLLAFGGALVAGNVLALVRPPAPGPGEPDEQPERPPLGRSLALIGLGAVIAVWALASLVGG